MHLAMLGKLGKTPGEDGGSVPLRHGISAAAIYNWESRFCALDLSEAVRLPAMESEPQVKAHWIC